MNRLVAIFFALAALLLPAGASAQVTQTFTGNTLTDGVPRFMGAYPTIIVPFYSTTGGTYTLFQSSDGSIYDPYLIVHVDYLHPRLYTDNYPPTPTEANYIGYNDDGDEPGDDLNSRLVLTLDANRQYYAALSSFSSNDGGPTTFTVTGPNAVVFADDFGLPVPPDTPEPGSWALMLTGFGVAGAALRHRRRMTPAS